LEIAGLLFGRRTGQTVYIAAHRAIECEHALGPSFTMSQKDTERLQSLLGETGSDPELAGLENVGWYVSHTRRPFKLVPGDLEIVDRFFPEPLKLTAIVQPAATGKARFSWFARTEDGSLDSTLPVDDFTISPPATHPSNGHHSPVLSKGTAATAAALSESAPGLSEAGNSPSEAQSIENHSTWYLPRKRALVTTGSLVFILTAVWVSLRLSPTALHPPPLHVLDTGSQLRIDWDPTLPVVQKARSGVLQIKEPSGAPIDIALSGEMLRSGSVYYDKPSSKVEVHLRLKNEQGSMSESMVYFIGRDLEPDKPIKPVAPAAAEPAQVPLLSKVAPPPAEKGSAERARSTEINSRRFQPPVVSKNPPVWGTSLVDPPQIPMAQPSAAVPLRTEVPEVLPPPVVTQVQNTPSQPTSGRIIWSGELHKGSVLNIGDRGPSSGSLNGKLPARPIKVSVHSAELLDGVIAVYTPDANSMRTAEAPGRRNGWNVTMYKFDPKHAHDLSLVETPSEENNFKLGIKSNNRPVSIIVIDWRATN
jgi:hypothetical protein